MIGVVHRQWVKIEELDWGLAEFFAGREIDAIDAVAEIVLLGDHVSFQLMLLAQSLPRCKRLVEICYNETKLMSID